jgi:multidrug resistance efflux pump
MKRGLVFLLVAIVVGGALAGGWWWARTSPEQATEFLVEGGLEASKAQDFVAAIGGQTQEEEEEVLVASGSIEGDELAIVSEFGGRIVGIYAGEGDEVLAGQVLVELDTSLLQAQIAQAQAAVTATEAQLESVKAGTHPAEVLGAEAALRQALAEREAARSAWQDALAVLDNPQEIDAQIVQAKAMVDLADGQIEQAKAQIASAEAERDRYRAQGSMQEKGLYRVYDYQVQAAQSALDAAMADKKGARETLRALRALRDNPLVLTSQVHLAEAQFEVAAAGVGVANAKLTELKAGPSAEDVRVAEAQVAQAQAAVSALETQMEKLVLRAPIGGIVTSRSAHTGEAAVAGTTLLTLANLDEVKLTIYIPEDELGRVYLGQQVEVRVDSFPDRVFEGTVAYISQQAEFTPKNVQTEKERVNMVFAVRVRLPNPDHLLKPGMPADASLSANSGS